MNPARSTDPQDYQNVPRCVAAMAKSFADREETGAHAHPRDQLIHAVSGVMRVDTAAATWIVPPGRALYMPAGVVHSVAMRGRVEMRTLYIRAPAGAALPAEPVVLEVSELLRALILALLEEPLLYDEQGRGGHLAGLIIDEIARARQLALKIPMPRDVRLTRLCERLMADPASGDTLDRLAEGTGASVRTLTRLFQSETGLTFTQWRQRLRFTNAFEALARGAPVGEVARSCGYASPSAFTAAFRKALGVTPAALARNAAT